MTEKKKLTLSKTLSADVLKKAQSKFDQNRSKTVTFEVKGKRQAYGPQKIDDARGEKLTDKELSLRMDAIKSILKEENTQKPEPQTSLRDTEIIANKNQSSDIKNTESLMQEPVESGVASVPSVESKQPVRDSFYDVKKVRGTAKKTTEPKYTPFSKPTDKVSSVDPKAKAPVNNKTSDKQKIDVGTLKRQGKMAFSSAVDERREKIKNLSDKKNQKKKPFQKHNQNSFVVREVEVSDVITVHDLANQMAVKTTDVIKLLLNLGMSVTINQSIDAETAEIVIAEFGHKLKRSANIKLIEEIENLKVIDDDGSLQEKPPVVTVMGHVDHGKTSLLDTFRKSDVVASEFGGITQKIGAYQVTLKNGKKITFIDTPGHEAFTAMRSRGADVTNIVVLVVAADDGIKPQTIEAINHAKAAKVPLIVAINKIDKPGVDPNKIRQELLQYDVAVESYGGDILDAEVSAKTRQGIERLEELILLQAEMLNLKANPNRSAEGNIIEAKLQRGLGTIATVLVKNGTLHKGDFFVAGKVFGKVKSMMNDKGEIVDAATPGMPVEVIGFEKSPMPGDDFVVFADESKAKEIANLRDIKYRESLNAVSAKKLHDDAFAKVEDSEIKNIDIILKADMHGSIEAIKHSIGKLANDEVTVSVIHSGIGEITENDIVLAKASKAIVIGFNVRANSKVRTKAKTESVEISYYSIIYDVIDYITSMVEGMLSPEVTEEVLGYAEVKQVFTITKVGKIAGSLVKDGIIKRDAFARVIRDNTVIYKECQIKSLRKVKEDVKEVKNGLECGIGLSIQDVQEGDIIECFDKKETKKKLVINN